MQNIMGNTGQSAEARRVIEIPHDRHDTALTQERHPRAIVRQAINAVAFA
jgi:hypothetical protein